MMNDPPPPGTLIVGAHHDEESSAMASRSGSAPTLSRCIARCAFYNLGCPKYDYGVDELPVLQSELDRLLSSRDLVFLSGFGHVRKGWSGMRFRSVRPLFENMMTELRRDTIKVYCNEPYVALINFSVWTVLGCYQFSVLNMDEYAQVFLLRHNCTDLKMRVISCGDYACISTRCSIETKRNVLCELLKECGFDEPAGWILGGNIGLPQGLVQSTASEYLKRKDLQNYMPRGEHSDEPEDFVLFVGIQADKHESLVGKSLPPSFSRGHDSVNVVG